MVIQVPYSHLALKRRACNSPPHKNIFRQVGPKCSPLRWSDFLKIGIWIWQAPQRVPFDMGIKIIEKFFFYFFHCPKGAIVTQNRDFFYENGRFSVIIFYSQLVACPVIYY